MCKTFMRALASLAACDGTAPTETTATLPVIRAYLYAGERVAPVQMSSTIPINSTDTVGSPVNNAALVRCGMRFTLARSAGDSGYYHYAGSDLIVAANDTFDLHVTALGKSAAARTVGPPPPVSLTLSKKTLTIPDFKGGLGVLSAFSSRSAEFKFVAK